MIFSNQFVKPRKKKEKYIQPKTINLCLQSNVPKDIHNVGYTSSKINKISCILDSIIQKQESMVKEFMIDIHMNIPIELVYSLCT